jgi:hypothetical protein
MRLNADGDLPVTVVAKRDPPRVQIRFAAMRLTFTAAEAFDLARRLIDAVDQLRDDTRTNQREETAT